MKKILKIVALVLVVALIVMQFFRIDATNPPVVEGETLEAAVSVPPDISLILGRSCNDCHSHKTIYPWWINIQPGGWFMKDHVEHGRSHLNFSVFNTYDAKKQAHKLEETCEMVESAAMPLPSYLWLHGDAVLAPSEAKALCDWANAERARIAL
jgi:hypothetical protein